MVRDDYDDDNNNNNDDNNNTSSSSSSKRSIQVARVNKQSTRVQPIGQIESQIKWN